MSSNSKEAIILSDWIHRALAEVDLSALAGKRYASSKTYGTDPSQWPSTILNSMALCSDDYLMPALQVAYSLANQICKEEETGKSPPLSSVDWVDNIVVYINNRVGRVSMCDSARRGSVDSLAFLDSLGFDPSDAGGDNFADNLIESILHDHDGTTTINAFKRAVTPLEQNLHRLCSIRMMMGLVGMPCNASIVSG